MDLTCLPRSERTHGERKALSGNNFQSMFDLTLLFKLNSETEGKKKSTSPVPARGPALRFLLLHLSLGLRTGLPQEKKPLICQPEKKNQWMEVIILERQSKKYTN